MYTPEDEIDLNLRPTQETYDAFQIAYDHFNWQLFDARLPNCLITLQRRKRSLGHFCEGRFKRADGTTCAEIALNPSYFLTRSLEEVLSTLVHEQVHLWQSYLGKPGRGRYHNREWAEKMKSLGLYPSHTGQPDGRELGDQMDHYIIEGGTFQEVAAVLIAGGFTIEWRDTSSSTVQSAPRLTKGGKRIKYLCPECSANALSKHDANIFCGVHMCRMEAQ